MPGGRGLSGVGCGGGVVRGFCFRRVLRPGTVRCGAVLVGGPCKVVAPLLDEDDGRFRPRRQQTASRLARARTQDGGEESWLCRNEQRQAAALNRLPSSQKLN